MYSILVPVPWYQESTEMIARMDDGLLKSVLSDLDEFGYAIMENYISNEQADSIKSELMDLFRYSGRNKFEGFKTKRLYGLFGKTRVLDSLAVDPLILKVAEYILQTENFLLSAPTGILINPDETSQLLHRDDGKYPLTRPHEDVIFNTMWALDEFTEFNGSTVLLPGSHTDDDLSRPSIQALMPKGSVLLYRGSVWHGGGANTTDTSRLGVILEYCAGWLRPQENHILVVPKEIVKQLDSRLQELLGYSVERPFIGYVNGSHPKKSLL